MKTINPKRRTKTILSTAKDTIQMNRETVMNMLDLDDLAHNQMLFDFGCEFLNRHAPEGTEDFTMISKSIIYWNWYKNEWSHMQDSFIRMAKTFLNLPIGVARASYREHMHFNCVQSEAVLHSFDNLLKIVGR